MPELPEVETVRRGLEAVLKGRRIVDVDLRRPDLRIPFPPAFAKRVAGRTVARLRRKAKYLLLDLDDGQVVICHLGMSGHMLINARGHNMPPRDHDHVVLTLEDGTRVVFNDHRRFGLMTLATRACEDDHPLLAHLAPDPLDTAFTPATLHAGLVGRKLAIKAALLNQAIVGGVGNIYACEALHRARISPRRLAANVGLGRCIALTAALRNVLDLALAAGGSSLRNHLQASGEPGYFQHDFRVYGREHAPCPVTHCGGTIRRIVQSGRSTFYCGRCQR